MSSINENAIELFAIRLFERLGYEYNSAKVVAAYAEAINKNSVLLINELYASLKRINPDLSDDVLTAAIDKLKNSNLADNLIENNKLFHQLLTEGISIDSHANGETIGELVKVIDFSNPANNDFLVANQITYKYKNYTKRPDVVLFINGIPLVVLELKNPVKEQATLLTAYQQLENYKATISDLFVYNELLIISDGLEAKAGSLSANFSRFMAWKSSDGKEEAKYSIPQLEVLINGMLNKTTLLDLIRHFTVFEETSSQDDKGIISKHIIKKIAAYHQYYAVNAAVVSTLRAADINTGVMHTSQLPVTQTLQKLMSNQRGDHKAGVVWHTQGSGKSLSMVFYSGKIVLTMNNPTLIVLTDRNDLDDQLFNTFAASKQLLRQEPVQAKNREHLKSLLAVASGGVIFTTIQKFSPEEGNVFDILSERTNIVVIADEAHRSQYGFKAKVRKSDQEIVYGFAKYLRDALPNATYLGFTGTPIEKADTNTPAVFGDYVDIYDIAQAVEDGATVPIYYESRLAEIKLSEEGKALIEAFDKETEDSDEGTKTLISLEDIVGNIERIKQIAQDIVKHFQARQEVFAGKGMIVCMNRPIAAKLYDEIIKLKPDWVSEGLNQGSIKVVFTSNSSDTPDLTKHHTTTKDRRRLADRMRDPDDPLKLVIVCDMWLTGFDVPCLHTMYIDKPMKGHTLMQAIARVNRVYKDKPGGLIVDYLGIAADLKQALSFYSDAGGKGDPTLQQEQAVQLMLQQMDIIEALLHGFDYQRFFSEDIGGKLNILSDAVEHILSLDNGKERYIQAVTALSKAYAIAIPRDEALAVKDKVALFQQIKARLAKLSSDENISHIHNETTIKQLIDKALVVDQIIDIYDETNIKNPDISILSADFLEEMKGYKHKNIAIETLKKILAGEIRGRSKVNVVQSKSLMEMLETTINKYHNKIITAAEVIEELIRLSRKIVDADSEAKALDLTEYEYAFYTAVANNQSAKELMQQDKLRELAVVLTQTIRETASIDWTKKESVQAKLRVAVKRLLKRYGYPPDMHELATETVLKQAELIADNLN